MIKITSLHSSHSHLLVLHLDTYFPVDAVTCFDPAVLAAAHASVHLNHQHTLDLHSFTLDDAIIGTCQHRLTSAIERQATWLLGLSLVRSTLSSTSSHLIATQLVGPTRQSNPQSPPPSIRQCPIRGGRSHPSVCAAHLFSHLFLLHCQLFQNQSTR